MTSTDRTEKPLRQGAGPLGPGFADALGYAATLHREQLRKNTNIPYVSHLMSVSALVLEDGGSEDEAIGGLLHDAAEDCGREVLPEIERRYGSAVRQIVEGCSDDLPEAGAEKRPWTERKTGYIDHLREADTSVVRVSAADKLHNAEATLADLLASPDRQWPKFNACYHELLWYYSSLAEIVRGRLGDSRTAVRLDRTVQGLFDETPGVDRPSPSVFAPSACECPESAAARESGGRRG